ncbi:DUF5686 family protein [Flavobacterium caeni]|uniref:CarboxypepD_reg-like domain-containing protein n=1 Tax=Flavobacterium caeni TaxID=490189 RepID=A0A1G5G3U0_9FLAO|nr:DUF5686 family protein [Flavobacterium caeni]SCY45900.1 CarboxypepD_reg-like domain-containing protein [Flavobacterium caeni]
MAKRLLLLCVFFSLAAQAQIHLNGVIRDASTKKPLPFASITTPTGLYTMADVDGKFTLESLQPVSNFTVSYVGFDKANVAVSSGRKFYSVWLQPASAQLDEVSVAPDQAAVNLIRRVVRDKNQNNPQKKLAGFEFKAYNKLVITANPDSIDGRIDSIFANKGRKKKLAKVDSSDYKFKKVIREQHLFQTEKVSQYQFAQGHLKETVLGTKMSGFKQPIYEILAFNLQSFSVYEDRYELFETRYNSPIAADSYTDYNFKIIDSTTIDGRQVKMVYFKNKKKSKAAGLEGVLYIDTENFAVAKAIMRIRGVLDISGVHEFEYLPDQRLWFPTNKSFKIIKGKNNDDIRVLGETLKFDSDDDGAEDGRRPRVASDFTYVLSETNYFDQKYNVPVVIRHPSIYIEVKDDAEDQPETFWNRYRKDSLDLRSQKTYVALDSLVEKERIEKRLLQGRKILNGYAPLGPVDLDLRYLLSYNNYEGFRFGLGGRTNERFSRKYRIDGYTAYGIKDGAFKYSLGFSSRIGKFSNSWVGASYTDDVREIGSTSFAIDKRVFKLYDPRPINVSTFYQHKTWRAYLETKILPKTESIWQLTYSNVEPKFSYVYNRDNELFYRYTMTTAQASVQWNPFSDYMQTPHGRIEVEKRFPKFTFQFTQALPEVLGNDFVFSKIDFRTEYERKYMNGQKTSLLFEAGYAHGDVPLTHLYNNTPNNLTKDRLLQRITIAGKNAFETMYFNEFFSSRYAMLQFKHALKRFKIVKKVRPEFVILSRAAYGDLDNREQHVGFDYKTLENGYFESGLEINQIYSAFGLAGFYRYGPNQLPRFEDNLAVKISFVLNLGF